MQVDTGVFMNSNSVPYYSQTSLLVRTRACDQLTLTLALKVDDAHVNYWSEIGEGFQWLDVRSVIVWLYVEL